MKNYKNVMRYAATAFGRGVRVMAAFDIAKARTRCEELRGTIAAARTQLAEHVQAGTGTAEELGNLRNTIAHDVQEYNDLMENVNRILRLVVTGETDEGGCSGNCATCGGCGG